MRLVPFFLAHEWITQWRSMRFRGLAAVYVLVCSAPAVAILAFIGRSFRIPGPATYNTFLLSVQPLLTALLATGIAVDGIARERDEGSFAVLSVAPLSSTGYVLRRWLALAIICGAVSLVPVAVTAAVAAHTRETLPLLPMFFEGWLMATLPALLVASALAMALGTITGRTVLAIIFGALLITAGIGILDGFLFYIGLYFGGPGQLFTGSEHAVQELIWTLRGRWFPRVPSDAAFPLRSESRMLLARAGITAAMAALLLAASAFYMRRTRRDLRPRRIPEAHQLRTMLRTANRIREEYAPDAGSSAADRVALLAAVAVAALLVMHLVHRDAMFTALGDARYAAEGSPGVPTSLDVAAQSVRIDADVALDGHVRSRAVSVIRNGGAAPQSHLSFVLQPMLAVRRLALSRGAARTRRLWHRLDLELDPPLAPGESRTLTADLDGVPAEIDFEIQAPGNFAVRWNRRRHATEEIYMTDLARSTVEPWATEVRMRLLASDLAPVLRYTPWAMRQQAPWEDEELVPEAIAPPAAIEVRLKQPYALAVDSCGSVAARDELASRCTAPLAAYAIFGGPLARRDIAPAATLAFIPAHERLAMTHAHALASSLALAAEAWPRLNVPSHVMFIERPNESGDRNFFFEMAPWRTLEQMGAGSVFFVPESAFTTRQAFAPNMYAAAIVTGLLRAKRSVAPEQATFFTSFYTVVALNRLGLRKTNAVEPSLGVPDTDPLVIANGFNWRMQRMGRVLAALEYRVGSDNFRAGVDDFLNAAGTGTAKELIDTIGRRAGIDLTRTYDDYFAGRALPELTLTDVKFAREGGRWAVTGAVKNNAKGEAFVPVALRTSQESLWQTVRVDSGGVTRFAFSATAEPRSLQLDPDQVCYRHAVVGLVDNVEYR